MWNLPGLGIKPMSPALTDGFLTTGPPEKSLTNFVHLGPLRIFIRPFSATAAKPTNSLTHSQSSTIGGCELIYTKRDQSCFSHHDLWVDSIECELNYKPWSFQGPGGPRVQAAQKRHHACPRGDQGVAEPHGPSGPVPCDSAAPNNS